MEVKEVSTERFIIEAATRLEKLPEIKPPAWSIFVKTGVSRQRPPTQENWWFLRSASILRKIYMNPGMGVNRMRKVYGGRKNRGHPPEHSFLASGAIIRKSIQQLEAAGLLKPKPGKIKTGCRVLSEKGVEFVKSVSDTVAK